MFDRVYPAKRPARTLLPGNVVASILVHAAAFVAAGISLPVYVNQQVTDGMLYFAPLPVDPSPEPAGERLTYLDLAGGSDGLAAARGQESFTDGLPSPIGQGGADAGEGDAALGIAALAALPQINIDSVYFPDEVDNPAAYDPRSAAPAYPDSLQSARIEGSVTAQFIVDTTGRAADSSFVIVDATHPRFAQAVRDALPRMLFRPAELRGTKIMQLVQQRFSFRLPPPTDAARDTTTPVVPPPPDRCA